MTSQKQVTPREIHPIRFQIITLGARTAICICEFWNCFSRWVNDAHWHCLQLSKITVAIFEEECLFLFTYHFTCYTLPSFTCYCSCVTTLGTGNFAVWISTVVLPSNWCYVLEPSVPVTSTVRVSLKKVYTLFISQRLRIKLHNSY